MNYDVGSIVLEEVALEGLEGITLDSLWVRLGALTFPLNVHEDDVRSYLWLNVIRQKVKSGDLFVYLLPVARPTILLYNRYDHVNPESGNCVEDDRVEHREVYEVVKPVSDGKVRGCCKYYKERKNITQHVLQKRFTYDQVTSIYGQKLVLVATQSHRERALQLTYIDPCLDLTPIQYAVLERIGRARYMGEATVGREATQYEDSPKTLFYYRKRLINKGLVKKQQLVLYDPKTAQNKHGLVLMLSRFFSFRLTPMQIIARKVNNQLIQEPNNECDYYDLRDKLDVKNKTFRHMFPSYVKNFKVYEVDSEDEEGKKVTRRFVKLLRSVEAEDDEDEEPEGEDDDEECSSWKSSSDLARIGKIFDPAKILADRPMLSQTLHVVEAHQSGGGISLREIGEHLLLPKLEVRALMRVLERLNEVSPIRVERGRQKVTLYIPRNKSDDAKKQFDAERKSLSYDVKDTITFLRRANLVLEVIKENKIVDQLFALKKAILQAEQDTPYSVDQKSVRRIIHKLALQGHIRSIKTTLTCKDKTRKVHIVCDPSITADSPLIREKIEQMKFRYFGTSEDGFADSGRRSKKQAQKQADLSPVDDEPMVLVYQPSMGRRYGLLPKMRKVLTLYQLLFHILYERPNTDEHFDDWRRFIQPIPKGTYEEGVCLLGDIIPRIPLSIFVKIVFITYVIPELEEYLNDPIAIHHTLSMLPGLLRKKLMFKRKFIFNLVEELTSLSYLNLVNITYKDQHPKETLLLNLLKRAELKDENCTKKYEFETLTDVELFVQDLSVHCSAECTNCSLDKRLFAHNPKNWRYAASSVKLKQNPVTRCVSSKPSKARISTNLKTSDNGEKNTIPAKRVFKGTKRKLSFEAGVTSAESNKRRAAESISSQKSTSRKRRQKRARERQEQVRKPYYDVTDLTALKLMKKSRCEWTKEEDSFLLMCRVASVLLDPTCVNHVCVPGKVIRDELHKHYPQISLDKTVKACQRRIVYMLKKEQTRQNVKDWVLECKQDLDTLDIRKPTVPKTHTEVWKHSYLTLLYSLLTKFQAYHLSNAHQDLEYNITSLDEIREHFNLVESQTHLPEKPVLHKDPQNVVDIYVNVVSNVLLSTLLSSSAENSSRPFAHTLWKIYQRYPDVLIRSVITKMQKNGIMTKMKRGATVLSIKTRGMTPFKITLHYMFILKTRLCMDTLPRADCDFTVSNGSCSSDAALVTSLFTSRNAVFTTEIPDVFVNFDENMSRGLFKKGLLEGGSPSALQAKSSSRAALYVLRQRLTANPVQSSLQEFLVLNPCFVNVCPKDKAMDLTEFKEKLELLSNAVVPCKYSESVTANVELSDFVKTKKDVGATEEEIRDFCGGIWPEEDIMELTRCNLIYRVGVTRFLWVHCDYINAWLVHSVYYPYIDSNRPTSNSKPISFIGRAWRTSYGSTSSVTLFRFLAAILGHIMLNPGVMEENLFSHFHICLPPVQIMELLELLISAKCVSKITLKKKIKHALFESDACGEQIDVTYYESSPDAYVKLCFLKKQLCGDNQVPPSGLTNQSVT